MNRTGLREEAEKIGLVLSDKQLDSFESFEGALYTANATMNLTRVAHEECWIRHFLDSILFHDLIPQGAKVLDIGTGPGFPAWPLACARPDLTVLGLDSSGKMVGFLRSQKLSNLDAVEERAENLHLSQDFTVVTGRALAPLSIQLELSASPCVVGGLIIPMRTERDLDEIERLAVNPFGLELMQIERRVLPVLEALRIFPVFQKALRTPTRFPRKWAEIKTKPL